MSIKEINKSPKISVIGVGYVGLPLLVALNDHFEVTGFDIGIQRIKELNAGKDITNELNANELEKLPSINFSPMRTVSKTLTFIFVVYLHL